MKKTDWFILSQKQLEQKVRNGEILVRKLFNSVNSNNRTYTKRRKLQWKSRHIPMIP